MKLVVTVLAAAALLVLPVASNAQVVPDSTIQIFAFVPEGFTGSVIVDWYGVGGSNQEESGFITGDLPGNVDESPDSCLDQDSQGYVAGNLFIAVPSLAQKNVKQDPSTLVPGTSVAADSALIALCSTVRENVFGQPSGFQYADDPQSVGFGDVNAEASSFALVTGGFDDALTANPSTLQALVCQVDLDSFAGTEAQGDEVFGGTGFDNGVLLAQVSTCDDVAADILSFLCDDNCQGNEPEQWDAGAINSATDGNIGVALWDLDLYDNDVPFGLTAVCFKATVVDAANAVAGFFEDYGYFWVDGAENTYALAPNWSLPTNSDGRALAQDCSSIGIPL